MDLQKFYCLKELSQSRSQKQKISDTFRKLVGHDPFSFLCSILCMNFYCFLQFSKQVVYLESSFISVYYCINYICVYAFWLLLMALLIKCVQEKTPKVADFGTMRKEGSNQDIFTPGYSSNLHSAACKKPSNLSCMINTP